METTMKNIFKILVATAVLASGAVHANADPFAVHGFKGTVYGSK
jgi:hypothetical protein